MAKLRKTLGGIDWPVCEALMRQIETQSTVTPVSYTHLTLPTTSRV